MNIKGSKIQPEDSISGQQDTTGRQHNRTARYNHKDSMNRQMKAGTGR